MNKKVAAVAKKEFWGYFYNPVGYVYGLIMLLVSAWIFWGDVFVSNAIDVKPLFQVMVYLLSVLAPAITMGMVAEEKKTGTWELILSTGVGKNNFIWGKLLAGVRYLAVILTLTLPTLFSLRLLGKIDFGVAISGYLGILLLGATYLAIGIWVSSFSRQPAVAFGITTIILVINSLLGQEIIVSRVPTQVGNVLSSLSLMERMNGFYNGQISLSNLVFMLSIVGLFMWLANKANEKNN